MKNYLKKNIQKFVEIYKELRKERNSVFMFIPKNINFFEISILISYEYFDYKKSDQMLINLVIRDLQNKGILHKKEAVDYSFYKFENIIFHDVYLKTVDNQIFCRGTSIHFEEAYAKALGEVFERTSVKFINEQISKEIILGSTEEMRSKNLNFYNPKDFAQATQEQKQKFPNSNVNEQDIFSWIPVTDLKKQNQIYLPAQTVFYGTHNSYKEKNIIQQSTHGAGAGFDRVAATRSCVFEITHRHFFFKNWYNGDSLSAVDNKTIPENSELGKIIKDFEKRGMIPEFLDFTDEAGVPTIICFLNIFGGIFCGGSTSLTMLGAMQRAMSEAFSSYLWVQQQTVRKGNTFTSEFIDSFEPGFTDIKTNAYNRVFVYGNSYFVNNLDIDILKNKKVISYSDKNDKDKSFDFVSHAGQTFPDIFEYSVTNNVLEEYNYFASRVVVPQSYFFALDEISSRPILKDGIIPKNTKLSPFP